MTKGAKTTAVITRTILEASTVGTTKNYKTKQKTKTAETTATIAAKAITTTVTITTCSSRRNNSDQKRKKNVPLPHHKKTPAKNSKN